VRECRTPGSVRGVRRNAHPYRNKGRVLKHATPLMQRLLVDLPAVLSDEPLVGLKKRLRGRSHDRRRRCTDIADPPEDDGRRALARLRAADAGDAEDWASARTKLGFAYAQRSDGDRSENWELAIAAFTDALSVARGEPEEWAAASAHLGVAHCERFAGDRSENQERAIAAFEDTRAVWTRDGNPEEWASARMNLGIAWWERLAGAQSENQERAIAAVEDALLVWTREDYPDD
jgi:hypothetical protein